MAFPCDSNVEQMDIYKCSMLSTHKSTIVLSHLNQASNIPLPSCQRHYRMHKSAYSTMGDEGPVYFWKENDPEWGWLCQWYASPFHAEDEKIIYKHAEQYVLLHSSRILP